MCWRLCSDVVLAISEVEESFVGIGNDGIFPCMTVVLYGVAVGFLNLLCLLPFLTFVSTMLKRGPSM